jgi:hypothetical protein
VLYLDIELELVLNRLLIFIIFLDDFFFRDYLKQINLELILERLLEID